jgi:hypothetical protein
MHAHNMAIMSMFNRTSTGVQQMFNNIYQSVAGTAIGQSQFFQQAQSTYQDLQHGATARAVQAMRAQNEVIFEVDKISALGYIDHIQQAEMTMRRVVMCTPVVREMYGNGECHGYGDLYINSSPTGIGSTHYDYRQFNNGVVQTTVDDDGVTTSGFKIWHEAVSDERQYSIHDKRDFKITQQSVIEMMEDSEFDPTHPDNELL